MKPQLIVFGEDWGGLPSSTQHIIKQMSDKYAVTWVNSLGLRNPRANWHDVYRIFNKLGRLCHQVLRPSKNLKTPAQVIMEKSFKVVEPQYLPFLGSSIARRINRFLLYRLLKRNTHTVKNNSRPVIWITLPNAVDALYYLHNTGLVDPVVLYYCCDDFSALEGVDHNAVTAFETELAQQAGLIVATSDQLMDKFPNNKTHMVPHGVDTQLFSQPCARADDLPNGKPIAGFYGSIASWFDIELLRDVALLMSDWDFVLIGAVKVDVSPLENLENVHFLGPRSHEKLPSYSQHWQVSMLPFIVNEQVISSNPLKLREYMAAGRPIVSVDFPQARGYSRFVKIANTAQQFAKAIGESQLEDPQIHSMRQLKVIDESWQSVAAKIDGLIEAV